MFEIDEDWQLKSFVGLSPKEKAYSQIKLMMNAPWFLVTYAYGPNLDYSDTLLIGFAEMLHSLKGIQDIKVSNVYVITPDYVNQTRHVKIDVLKNLMIAKSASDPSSKTLIYQTLDDSNYYWPHQEHPELLFEFEVLYNIHQDSEQTEFESHVQ